MVTDIILHDWFSYLVLGFAAFTFPFLAFCVWKCVKGCSRKGYRKFRKRYREKKDGHGHYEKLGQQRQEELVTDEEADIVLENRPRSLKPDQVSQKKSIVARVLKSFAERQKHSKEGDDLVNIMTGGKSTKKKTKSDSRSKCKESEKDNTKEPQKANKKKGLISSCMPVYGKESQDCGSKKKAEQKSNDPVSNRVSRRTKSDMKNSSRKETSGGAAKHQEVLRVMSHNGKTLPRAGITPSGSSISKSDSILKSSTCQNTNDVRGDALCEQTKKFKMRTKGASIEILRHDEKVDVPFTDLSRIAGFSGYEEPLPSKSSFTENVSRASSQCKDLTTYENVSFKSTGMSDVSEDKSAVLQESVYENVKMVRATSALESAPQNRSTVIEDSYSDRIYQRSFSDIPLLSCANRDHMDFVAKSKVLNDRSQDDLGEEEQYYLLKETRCKIPSNPTKRTDSVSHPLLIDNYAAKEWKGETVKADKIRRGYERVKEETGYDYIRLIRGDNYCALRSVLFKSLSSGIDILKNFNSVTMLPNLLLMENHMWIQKWSFANRIPLSGRTVVEALEDCLEYFAKAVEKSTNCNEDTERYEMVLAMMNGKSEEEIKIYEAVKFLMLFTSIRFLNAMQNGEDTSILPALLFARDTSTNPEMFMKNHLNYIGDTCGLDQLEMMLLGHTLKVKIKVMRLHLVDEVDFITEFPDDLENPEDTVSLVAEDDRHYNALSEGP